MTAASVRIAAAVDRARADGHADGFEEGAPDGRSRPRRLVMGDPQAPLAQVMAILEAQGALGADGRLSPDVQLVSVGDHFDWGAVEERARATDDGLCLLAWLAAHPSDQVIVLTGNHDLARVGELCRFDDRGFEVARAAADRLYRGGDSDAAAERALRERYDVPSAEVLARDLSCFSVAQRKLV